MITIPLAITAEYNLDNKYVKICDNTDYESEYVGATQNIVGIITVYKGAVKIYENTDFLNANITPNILRCVNIDLPINGNGNIDGDVYNIVYTIKDNSDNVQVNTSLSCDICVNIPTDISISHRYDCLVPIFESVDNTKYNNCDVQPDLIERTHTLSYCANGIPFSEQPEDITTSNATITTNKLFTNSVVKSKLSLKFTYNLCPNVTLVKSISATRETQIDCPADLCKINCCVKGLANKYIKAKENGNEKDKDKLGSALYEVGALLSILKSSIECKKTSGIGKIINEIKEITGCDGDCGCETKENVSEPIGQFLFPNLIIETCPEDLTAVRDFDGQTFKYKLCLSEEIKDKLECISDVSVIGDEFIDIKEITKIPLSGCPTKEFTVQFDYDKFIEGLCISGDGCGMKVEKVKQTDCDEYCIVISFDPTKAIDIQAIPDALLGTTPDEFKLAKTRVEVVKQVGCPTSYFINTSKVSGNDFRNTTFTNYYSTPTSLQHVKIGAKYKNSLGLQSESLTTIGNISCFTPLQIPQYTFSLEGDEVEIEALFVLAKTNVSGNNYVSFNFNGAVQTSTVYLTTVDKYLKVKVNIIRTAFNTVQIRTEYKITGNSDRTYYALNNAAVDVSIDHQFNFCAYQNALNEIELQYASMQFKFV
jgi:hypothetical protein